MPPVHAFTLNIDESLYLCVHIENFLTLGINPKIYGRKIVEAYSIREDVLNRHLERNKCSELCFIVKILTFKDRFCICSAIPSAAVVNTLRSNRKFSECQMTIV